ncbi:hypothetical protein SprV_0802530100 [Sparganum proliferum]
MSAPGSASLQDQRSSQRLASTVTNTVIIDDHISGSAPPPITSLPIIPISTFAATPTTTASTPGTFQKSLFIPSTATFTITIPIYPDADSDLTCPRIGLAGRLGIYAQQAEH